jgi:predicted nucleotidyltransferase
MITKTDILFKLKELKPTLYGDYAVRELERPIGWKFFSLELYLEQIFNRKIDLVTKNALKDQIKDSILKQVNYV